MNIGELGKRLSDKSNAIARNRGLAPDRFLSLLAREQLLGAVGRVADEGTVAMKGSALVLVDPEMSGWVRSPKDLDLHMHGVTVNDLHDLLDRAAAEVTHVAIRVEYGACKDALATGRHGRWREGAGHRVAREDLDNC